MPGSSAVSPPISAHPAARHTSAAPSTSSATVSSVDPIRGDVVEEEERVGAAGDDVVDAVGGEVGAARAERAALAREDELRPDRVGRGGEEAVAVQRMEPRERAERRVAPVDSTAARSRSTTASAFAIETPAAS